MGQSVASRSAGADSLEEPCLDEIGEVVRRLRATHLTDAFVLGSRDLLLIALAERSDYLLLRGLQANPHSAHDFWRAISALMGRFACQR
jgi:hypothetical protein